ncbi:MAG: tetratricopeptide repeat protein [Bacteroidota bacterium]
MTQRWKCTRLTSSILVVGFFFLSACLSTETTTRETTDTPDAELALEEIDRRLDADEKSAPLLLERLEILDEIATERSPEDRTVYYEEMVQTAATSELQEDELANRTDELIRNAYEREFQAGESDLGNPQSSSLHHFENASVLQPEEGDPYRHISSIHYRQDRIPEAISTLETAMQQVIPYPPDMNERIAYLYLESGYLDEAITRYQSLVEEVPERIEIRHALINALILNEQHMDAVRELRELKEENPDNHQYRESLAIELFFHLQDHWETYPPSERDENEIQSDLEWVDEAMEELDQSDNPSPADTESAYVMAQFYRNSGLYLMEQADGLSSRIASELVSRGESLLKEAIPRWEAMADQNPENREIWVDLQEIYQKLGLDDQARQIDEQLNS